MLEPNKKKTKLETVLIPNAKAIEQMKDEGVSEKNIAERLGISYSTWRAYKKPLEEYLQSKEHTEEDKLIAVETAMYHAAIGTTKKVQKAMKCKTILYEHGKRVKEEEKIEYYFEDVYIPPNGSVGMFLLKNWDKTHYSNNPAELKQKIEEFNYNKSKEDWTT